MTHRTFRVSQLTCMACGHEQRCKLRVENGIEFEPDCHSCGRSDSWMSLPTLRPTLGPVALPIGDSVTPEFLRHFIDRLLHPSAFQPQMGDIVYHGMEPEEYSATVTFDSLVEFLDRMGIEVDYEVDGDDEL